VFALVGPPGAGKTTVLRILLGLVPPTAGTAWVLGRDVRSEGAAIRSQTGALVDSAGLYDRLTAQENLELFARIWRLAPAARSARIRELLVHFGLWERRDELPETWGQGLRQKLTLARTLLHRPRLLLLDEPARNLDPGSASCLHAELTALTAHEGVTVLFTASDLRSAAPFAQVVGILRNGRLLTSGSPKELCRLGCSPTVEISGRGFTQETVDLVRRRRDVHKVTWYDGMLVVELAGGASGAPVVNLLVESGAEVDEVRRAGAEEVYWALLEGSDAHQPG
jgi:ABC-2 type transport system ATP-binding protein